MANKTEEEKMGELLEKLHKSTNTLASAIKATPGAPEIPTVVDLDDEDLAVVADDSDRDTIRENNRKNVFEIINNRGRVIVLDINRAKNRIFDKISAWKIRQQRAGTIINGMSISTNRSFRNKMEKLMRKADDGELKFPIKFNTATGLTEITEDQLRAIYSGIQDHLDNCELKEQEIIAMIASAGSTDEIANILVENRVDLSKFDEEDK